MTNHKELPEFIEDRRLRYDYFAQGVETEAAFYLEHAMDKNNHGIFPKKHMTEDQVTALRELFIRQFGSNFKQYNQK